MARRWRDGRGTLVVRPGDGRAEVVVTPDQGGGPVVAVYDAARLLDGVKPERSQLARFFGIDDPAFRGGARATVGDVNGDGTPDLVVSAGFGGGPRIAVFNGQDVAAGNSTPGRLTPKPPPRSRSANRRSPPFPRPDSN